jgi:hypothetical protein
MNMTCENITTSVPKQNRGVHGRRCCAPSFRSRRAPYCSAWGRSMCDCMRLVHHHVHTPSHPHAYRRRVYDAAHRLAKVAMCALDGDLRVQCVSMCSVTIRVHKRTQKSIARTQTHTPASSLSSTPPSSEVVNKNAQSHARTCRTCVARLSFLSTYDNAQVTTPSPSTGAREGSKNRTVRAQ